MKNCMKFKTNQTSSGSLIKTGHSFDGNKVSHSSLIKCNMSFVYSWQKGKQHYKLQY